MLLGAEQYSGFVTLKPLSAAENKVDESAVCGEKEPKKDEVICRVG